MGEAQTRADLRAGTETSTSTGRTTPAWRAPVMRGWPFVAMVLAALLWWPAGFAGRAELLHLPFSPTSGRTDYRAGDAILLGSLVAAAVVAALVRSPWPKFGIAAGLTALAWLLSEEDVTFAARERPVLAGLAGVGLLLGLAVGARAFRGPVAIAGLLALLAGLSPATWSRGVLLAVAVALPFWAATKDRVAPTVFAVVRVILTWLVAVLVSVGLQQGFGAVPAGGLARPTEALRTVAEGFVTLVRERWFEVVEAAARAYTGWIWLAVVLAVAVALVLARLALARRKH